jgi:hypothetical protein
MTNYLTAIFSLTSLALLWFLLFWLYEDYCVEMFRQKVFSLRDELFDAAAFGKIPFNHKGYGRLRVTMNGSIRFAHEISLLHFLIFSYMNRNQPDIHASYNAIFSKEIEGLSPAQRETLHSFHDRFNALLIKHMLANSPVLVLVLFLPLFFYFTLKSVSSLVAWFRKNLEVPLDEMQSLAYAVGRD